jgi:putative glutathione S-transferase
MGLLINGQWQKGSIAPQDSKGDFIRLDSVFRQTTIEPEANRYHLYISYACPWACRTLIFLVLKGLEDTISFSPVEPLMLEMGWAFGQKGTPTADPLYQLTYLHEIYQKASPTCSSKVTVPVLWDKKTQTIVNNESSEIIRIFNSGFNQFAENAYDFYPNNLQDKINEINDFVYQKINNGVYKCGFSSSQAAYERAYDNLFSALDKIEALLGQQAYLVGDNITEADWRLFTTLIRFDQVYVSHFKCNKKCLREYPNLSNYVRALYQIPGIKKTVDFNHIKTHYFGSHLFINPTGIIPKGPDIDFDAPHNRTVL